MKDFITRMKLSNKSKRLLIILAVMIGIYAYTQIRKAWSPKLVHKTEHYKIESNQTEDVTKKIGTKLENQYQAYTKLFEGKKNKKLYAIRVYKDRKEFKRVNPDPGWAEALYIDPVCHFYIDTDKANPYHWGFHEAVHQLNNEYAGLNLPIWADEGLATLFSTAIIDKKGNLTKKTDPNTYPMWWIPHLELTNNIKQDIKAKQFIAIKDIVHSREPIRINIYFNKYYIMWWALTHELYWGDDGKYRKDYLKFIQGKTSLNDFYKKVILPNNIETKVHQKLKKMKAPVINLKKLKKLNKEGQK